MLTRQSTPDDLMVGRWVQLQQEMVQHQQQRTSPTSSQGRSKSASPYQRQPIESLSVSFAKLLVNQINGTSMTVLPGNGKSSKKKKTKKKDGRRILLAGGSSSSAAGIRSTIRNNTPVTQIDHVEEWLQQRSPYYAWWRKLTTATTVAKPSARPSTTSLGVSRPTTSSRAASASSVVNRNVQPLPINKSQPFHPPSKSPRCVLWFIYTGNPSKRPNTAGSAVKVLSPMASAARPHSIRIEQQPLGGNNAVVFAADLHIGEEFAIVSRRQPGFTFSLTFFIDGVRHARLSGCCENARNIHIPTRVGGPIGAFVLRAVQGGEHCQMCEKSAPFADPELFTVRPKSSHHHHNNNNNKHFNTSQEPVLLPPRKRGSLRRTGRVGPANRQRPSSTSTSPSDSPSVNDENQSSTSPVPAQVDLPGDSTPRDRPEEEEEEACSVVTAESMGSSFALPID